MAITASVGRFDEGYCSEEARFYSKACAKGPKLARHIVSYLDGLEMQLVSYTGHCVSPKLVEKPLWRSSAMQRGEGSPLQFPKHFEQHLGDIAELELNENPLGEEKFHQLKCLQPGHPWRSSEFHVGSTSSRSFLLWFCFIYFVNRWS